MALLNSSSRWVNKTTNDYKSQLRLRNNHKSMNKYKDSTSLMLNNRLLNKTKETNRKMAKRRTLIKKWRIHNSRWMDKLRMKGMKRWKTKIVMQDRELNRTRIKIKRCGINLRVNEKVTVKKWNKMGKNKIHKVNH